MNTLFDYLPWSAEELAEIQLAPGEQISYVSPAWLTVRVPHADGTYHTRMVTRAFSKQKIVPVATRKKRRGDHESTAKGMF